MVHLYAVATADLSKYRNFIFDIDNTLVPWSQSVASMLLRMYHRGFKAHGISLDLDRLVLDETVKGAVIDKRTGAILRVDAQNRVRAALLHEWVEDSFAEEASGLSTIDFKTKRFQTVNSYYAVFNAAIYHWLRNRGILPAREESYGFVSGVIDRPHRDGTTTKVFLTDPMPYLDDSVAGIFEVLDVLSHTSKRSFIVTNNSPEKADILLRNVRYNGKSMKDYFPDDSIAAGSGIKPEVFHNGNFRTLAAKWGINLKESVYIGDDIYSDMVEPHHHFPGMGAIFVDPSLRYGLTGHMFWAKPGVFSLFGKQFFEHATASIGSVAELRTALTGADYSGK